MNVVFLYEHILKNFTWYIWFMRGTTVLIIHLHIFYNFQYFDSNLLSNVLTFDVCRIILNVMLWKWFRLVRFFFKRTKLTVKEYTLAPCLVTREGAELSNSLKLLDHRNLTWGDYTTVSITYAFMYLSLGFFSSILLFRITDENRYT
jgi:hypothetical protein